MCNNDVISDVKIIACDQSMNKNLRQLLKSHPKNYHQVTEVASSSGSVCVWGEGFGAVGAGGGTSAPLLVTFCCHSFLCSCPQKYAKQECIPVGCDPSAAVAV